MLTVPPSLQQPYTEYYSGDPAFVQLPKNANAKDKKDHARKLKSARERGDWSALLIGGSEPTAFKMNVLEGDQFRTLVSMNIGGLELFQLAFRCAIADIENAGELTVTRVTHPRLGTIASADVTNALDKLSTAIVNELGALALERAGGPPPLT